MKVLAIAIPGMGNTILTIPMLRALNKNFPNIKIDLLVGLKSSAIIMENCPYLNKIYIMDQKINKNTIKILYTLNREKYDISFTTFPAKQDQYNILAKIINAKKRITHDYKSITNQLQNIKIPIKNTHDIKQNLNLLSPLKINNISTELELWPKIEKKKENLKTFIIGLHPGSSVERGMIKKRWPPEYFSKLIDLLSKKYNSAEFKIYLGPAEKELSRIKELSKNQDKIKIINKGLKETSSSIGECNLFISNDSGLMHIAAANQVPTVGIFLSTDERRTYPFCKNKLILKKGDPHLFYRQNIENLKGDNKPLINKNINIIKPEEAMKEIEKFIIKLK
jgi:ADP-heptose:LPS heptosyltransferase